MTPENRPASQDQTPRTAARRSPVRLKLDGGIGNVLTPGTDWRIERITEHYEPSGIVGEDAATYTRLDLTPIEAEAASLSAGDQVVDSFRRQARTILKSEWFRQRRRSLRTSEQPTVAQVIWLVEQLAAQPASRSGYHPAPPEPERPHPNPEGEWG